MYHFLILLTLVALVPFTTEQNYKIIKYISTMTSVCDNMIY